MFGEGIWKHISGCKGLERRLFYQKGQNSWEGRQGMQLSGNGIAFLTKEGQQSCNSWEDPELDFKEENKQRLRGKVTAV